VLLCSRYTPIHRISKLFFCTESSASQRDNVRIWRAAAASSYAAAAAYCCCLLLLLLLLLAVPPLLLAVPLPLLLLADCRLQIMLLLAVAVCCKRIPRVPRTNQIETRCIMQFV
jgi:hypothetical protein